MRHRLPQLWIGAAVTLTVLLAALLSVVWTP